MTPMTCPASTERHDGRDPRPVRLGLSRRVELRCAGCRTAIAAMGVTVWLVERRIAIVPVARDRRHVAARWIHNLRAVDRTGEVLAR